MCLIVFLLTRAAVGLVAVLARRTRRDERPRPADDDLVLAA